MQLILPASVLRLASSFDLVGAALTFHRHMRRHCRVSIGRLSASVSNTNLQYYHVTHFRFISKFKSLFGNLKLEKVFFQIIIFTLKIIPDISRFNLLLITLTIIVEIGLLTLTSTRKD